MNLRARRWAVLAAVAALGSGCYSTDEGPEPSPNALYFPVGLLPSPGGHALYVVNSDFDLQFNGGTVEVYNLDDIRDNALRPFWSPSPDDDPSDPCHGLGINSNPILYPGACGPLNLLRPPPRPVPYDGSIFRGGAKIGAFATDVVMACRPSAAPELGGSSDCMRGGKADSRGARLFVPVRGDRSLTYFDVDDDREEGLQTFKLDCGQVGNGACADANRTGIDPGENTRGLSLPAEPFGVAVSDRADAIVVTHQASGAGSLSLFSAQGTSLDDDVRSAPVIDSKPRLEFVLGGLPGSATGLAALPTPGIDAVLGFDGANYQPGFAVAYRLAAQMDVVRFFDDSFAAPRRPFLQRSAAFGFPPTSGGSDSRDVVIDTSRTSERAVCEQSCRAGAYEQCFTACDDVAAGEERRACRNACRDQSGVTKCMTDCSRTPVGIYVSNRQPPALLIGEIRLPTATGSTESLTFYDSVAISKGPSRVVVGRIHDRRDPPGVYRPRVFVVCFDARTVIVYDPAERRVDGLIRTGRGPHAFVMDPIHPIAYVGHFTDSYIGLVDLDQSHEATFETIVATIGIPVAPQGTK